MIVGLQPTTNVKSNAPYRLPVVHTPDTYIHLCLQPTTDPQSSSPINGRPDAAPSTSLKVPQGILVVERLEEHPYPEAETSNCKPRGSSYNGRVKTILGDLL